MTAATPAPDVSSGPALAPVHMFWHGPALSRVERLAISSFLAHAHPLTLHVYEEPRGVPPGAMLADARATLPAERLFRHRQSGSYAIFADWFRYCLLDRLGGIWADTDVVCLRPLVYPGPEIFAWEDALRINNAVLGLPAGHPLASWMAACCAAPDRFLPYDDFRSKWRKLRRRLQPGNAAARVKWGESGPTGFTAAVRHFGYLERALPAWHFYPVHYRDWRAMFAGGQPNLRAALERSSAVHLYNEMLRTAPGFDKNGRFPADSLFEELCARYLRSGS